MRSQASSNPLWVEAVRLGLRNVDDPSKSVAETVVRVCEARGMQEALDEVESLVAALGQPALFGLADLELVPVLRRVQSLIAALSALAAGLAGEAAGRASPPNQVIAARRRGCAMPCTCPVVVLGSWFGSPRSPMSSQQSVRRSRLVP